MHITIYGELADYNTFLAAGRKHRMIAAKIKQEETQRVVLECQVQKVPKAPSEPLVWRFTWYCASKRKDPDNISGGIKFIFDGLQKAGVIENDGWNQVAGIEHEFHVDKQNPRVEVTATKLETKT